MRRKGPSKSRFERIFADGKKSVGTGFRVYALPGSGQMGITTAKKIGCHAVRNRIKRRAREVTRPTDSFIEKLDWVLLVSERGVKLSLKDLSSEWQGHLTRMKELWASELEFS